MLPIPIVDIIHRYINNDIAIAIDYETMCSNIHLLRVPFLEKYIDKISFFAAIKLNPLISIQWYEYIVEKYPKKVYPYNLSKTSQLRSTFPNSLLSKLFNLSDKIWDSYILQMDKDHIENLAHIVKNRSRRFTNDVCYNLNKEQLSNYLRTIGDNVNIPMEFFEFYLQSPLKVERICITSCLKCCKNALSSSVLRSSIYKLESKLDRTMCTNICKNNSIELINQFIIECFKLGNVQVIIHLFYHYANYKFYEEHLSILSECEHFWGIMAVGPVYYDNDIIDEKYKSISLDIELFIDRHYNKFLRLCNFWWHFCGNPFLSIDFLIDKSSGNEHLKDMLIHSITNSSMTRICNTEKGLQYLQDNNLLAHLNKIEIATPVLNSIMKRSTLDILRSTLLKNLNIVICMYKHGVMSWFELKPVLQEKIFDIKDNAGISWLLSFPFLPMEFFETFASYFNSIHWGEILQNDAIPKFYLAGKYLLDAIDSLPA